MSLSRFAVCFSSLCLLLIVTLGSTANAQGLKKTETEAFDSLVARLERDSLRCLAAVDSFRTYYIQHPGSARAAMYLGRTYDKVGSFSLGCPYEDERFLPYVDSAISMYRKADLLQPGILYERLRFNMPRLVGHCYATRAMWDLHEHDFAAARRELKQAYDEGCFAPAIIEIDSLMLSGCKPNAILFTNGDDDTFEMWYFQLVRRFRTDVSVVNMSLFNMPWYQKLCQNGGGVFAPIPMQLIDTASTPAGVDFTGDWDVVEARANESRGIDTFRISSAARSWMKPYLGEREIPNQVITRRFRHKADGYGSGPICHAAIVNVLQHNEWTRPVEFAYGPHTEDFERMGGNACFGMLTALVFPIDVVEDESDGASALPLWVDSVEMMRILDHPELFRSALIDSLWSDPIGIYCGEVFDGYLRTRRGLTQSTVDALMAKAQVYMERDPNMIDPVLFDIMTWLSEQHLRCDRDLERSIQKLEPRVLAKPEHLDQESYTYATLLGLAGHCDALQKYRTRCAWARSMPTSSIQRQVYEQLTVILNKHCP